jgi:hypothetical protein
MARPSKAARAVGRPSVAGCMFARGTEPPWGRVERADAFAARASARSGLPRGSREGRTMISRSPPRKPAGSFAFPEFELKNCRFFFFFHVDRLFRICETGDPYGRALVDC